MLELIESAQATGLSAGYVLFGSCISSSITLISLKKECHIDALAMIKKGQNKIPAFHGCHSRKRWHGTSGQNRVRPHQEKPKRLVVPKLDRIRIDTLHGGHAVA